MGFANCSGHSLDSMNRPNQRSSWVRTLPPMSTSAVVVALLCLAALNIMQRASWSELEDGVLWKVSGGEVAAAEIGKGTAAELAGLRRGDVLLQIGDREVRRVDDVVEVLHTSRRGVTLRYIIMREQARQQAAIDVAPVPSSPLPLYFALAAVGVFSLLVGASVRLRRPDHQATLHFFWLTVAFFGVMAFSFSGKLDALDWTFYWGDLTAQLLLPGLFLHFALVFPDRPDAWVRSDPGRALLPAIYLPALLLGAVSVAGVINGAAHGDVLTWVASSVQYGQLLYLAVALPLVLFAGAGFIVFFLATAWLLGREYFELAAMRFRTPAEAKMMRKQNAATVFTAGLFIAAFVSIPIVNLATPLFGMAFMVHMHKRLSGPRPELIEPVRKASVPVA